MTVKNYYFLCELEDVLNLIIELDFCCSLTSSLCHVIRKENHLHNIHNSPEFSKNRHLKAHSHMISRQCIGMFWFDAAIANKKKSFSHTTFIPSQSEKTSKWEKQTIVILHRLHTCGIAARPSVRELFIIFEEDFLLLYAVSSVANYQIAINILSAKTDKRSKRRSKSAFWDNQLCCVIINFSCFIATSANPAMNKTYLGLDLSTQKVSERQWKPMKTNRIDGTLTSRAHADRSPHTCAQYYDVYMEDSIAYSIRLRTYFLEPIEHFNVLSFDWWPWTGHSIFSICFHLLTSSSILAESHAAQS